MLETLSAMLDMFSSQLLDFRQKTVIISSVARFIFHILI